MTLDLKGFVQQSVLTAEEKEQWERVLNSITPEAEAILAGFIEEDESRLKTLTRYLEQKKAQWQSLLRRLN